MLEPDSDPPRVQAPADDRLPPLARVIFYLPAYLITQLVTAGVILTAWLALSGRTAVEPGSFETTIPMILAVSAAYFPVLLVGTWLFARGLDRRSLAELGWRWPGGLGRSILHGSVALAAAGALFGVWLLVGWAGFTATFGGWAELGAAGVPSAGGLALVFGGFVMAAAVEELGFRGYVFHVLKERGSWASAAGLQAALFAALHASNPAVAPAGLLNTFLLGLALAALVEATGSLLAATVAHAAWNFAVALALPISGIKSLGVFHLELAGPAGWTGGAYGPEGSWLLSGLLMAVVFALALWADRRAPPAPRPQAP
jgi:membrane protease YdiL (CAAX protease family)